jgi:translation initiation factor 3 subunit B
MKTFSEYRQKNIDNWNLQKTRRLELRNSEFLKKKNVFLVLLKLFFFADIDTDELESDTKNVEEEEVEFLIKEEHTVIEE